MRLNYAIVFVSNMKRAASFYQDVLGLPLRFESPEWTEFATDGATLALHTSGAPTGPLVDGNNRILSGCYKDYLALRIQSV